MPKATAAAANITDITGSLRFRSEVNLEVKSGADDDHFTRVRPSLGNVARARPSASETCQILFLRAVVYFWMIRRRCASAKSTEF